MRKLHEMVMHFIKSRIESFRHAFDGLFAALRQGVNFRIQLLAAVVAVVLGIVLHISHLEWVAIALCIGSVLSAELMNTAIEKLCDRVSTEKHPLIKAAKDMSAAAVLLLAAMSVVVALLIFLPKLV
jgi:diacylglycerol kinase